MLCTDLTANEFFRASGNEESRYARLRRFLSELLQTDLGNVDIFSLANGTQSAQNHLSVWFAAHGSPYYRPEKLHGYMAMHKAKVTKGGTFTHISITHRHMEVMGPFVLHLTPAFIVTLC